MTDSDSTDKDAKAADADAKELPSPDEQRGQASGMWADIEESRRKEQARFQAYHDWCNGWNDPPDPSEPLPLWLTPEGRRLHLIQRRQYQSWPKKSKPRATSQKAELAMLLPAKSLELPKPLEPAPASTPDT